jgi:hypothetical protein
MGDTSDDPLTGRESEALQVLLALAKRYAGQRPPNLSVHLRAILKAVEASAVGSGSGTAASIFPELLTPRECAALRRCSVRKLDRERADGRGCPYVRIDGRIFYRRQDVDQFIAEHVRGLHARSHDALGPEGGSKKMRTTPWTKMLRDDLGI